MTGSEEVDRRQSVKPDDIRKALAEVQTVLVGAADMLARIGKPAEDLDAGVLGEIEPRVGSWEVWHLCSGASAFAEELLRMTAGLHQLGEKTVAEHQFEWREEQEGSAERRKGEREKTFRRAHGRVRRDRRR